MALLTSKATAHQILSLLQKGTRIPSRQAFTPQTSANSKLHPWKVRYSTLRKAYIVYIPAGAVAGVDLNLTELTKDTTLTDWYVVDVSALEDPTKLVLYLYGDKVSFTAPDPHEADAEKPSFTCLIAEITDISGTPPGKIVVKQIVTSTISLGGGSVAFYAPGPLKVETVDGSTYIVQRWTLVNGTTITEVDDQGIPDDDRTPRFPAGLNADKVYAAKFPLVPHVNDHADGVVVEKDA